MMRLLEHDESRSRVESEVSGKLARVTYLGNLDELNRVFLEQAELITRIDERISRSEKCRVKHRYRSR